MAPASRSALLIALALGTVYLVWGSTYLAIRMALEGLPPFALGGLRFLLAGGVLYAWVRAQGAPAPALRAWMRPTITGALLFVGGNGMVVWAQVQLASGLAALLVASVPLWVVLFGWMGGEPPSRPTLLGLCAGVAGVLLLVAGRAHGEGHLLRMLVLLVGGASWAAGSLYTRSAPQGGHPLMGNAQAMLASGVLLLLLSAGLGEWSSLDLASARPSAWVALVYLALFGSVVAFSAYAWLLRSVSPALASSYAFVNPAVAVLLGWLFANEPVGVSLLLGGGAIVLAVALLSTAPRRERPAPGREPGPTQPQEELLREMPQTRG